MLIKCQDANREMQMKFDSMRAWNEAVAMLKTNRDVLVALGGVFLMLPALAIMLLCPPPDMQGVKDPKVILAMFSEWFQGNWLPLVVLSLITTIGTLAVLAMFSSRHRPTVAEAIRMGAIALLPLVAAQLLMGMGIGLIGGIVIAIAAATQVGALAALAFVGVVLLMIYAVIRSLLVTPVVVNEQTYGPVKALGRTWSLTRGNFWALFGFFALLTIVTYILSALIGGAGRMLFTMIAGEEGGKIGASVLASLVGAVTNLIYLATLAATHRQLAGPSGADLDETFA